MVGVFSRYGVGAGSGTGEAVGGGGGGGMSAMLPVAELPRLFGLVRCMSTSQHREQFM